MNNAHSDGNNITVPVPAPAGGATSGVPFAYGVLVAIPVTDAAAGEPVAAAIEGVFVLPKLSTANITGGAAVTWDISEDRVIIASPAAGDVNAFGVAIEAAANGTATVAVKLTPGAGSVQGA